MSLDFFEPWQNVFIDDLRAAETLVEGRRCPHIKSLLHESPYHLVSTRAVDLSAILKDKFQTALGACKVNNTAFGFDDQPMPKCFMC